MINIRLPDDLFKRVKACCDDNESSIQEFVTDAIIEKLELSHKERRSKHRL
jgi:tartrate dehydratase alpha subunit/fumarate hydratase class I-like protein